MYHLTPLTHSPHVHMSTSLHISLHISLNISSTGSGAGKPFNCLSIALVLSIPSKVTRGQRIIISHSSSGGAFASSLRSVEKRLQSSESMANFIRTNDSLIVPKLSFIRRRIFSTLIHEILIRASTHQTAHDTRAVKQLTARCVLSAFSSRSLRFLSLPLSSPLPLPLRRICLNPS